CISSAHPFSWCWLNFACLCLYMHLHFLLCSFFLVYNKPDCASFFPGRIVSDSDHFHNKMHIWPEGYTAFRKFASVKVYSHEWVCAAVTAVPCPDGRLGFFSEHAPILHYHST
uniref:Uncharacterized protein n=1 Tax=Aegilops tauschii subsp. strangulata TaxID=200361 RepID=A0A453QPZ1_AEGTS